MNAKITGNEILFARKLHEEKEVPIEHHVMVDGKIYYTGALPEEPTTTADGKIPYAFYDEFVQKTNQKNCEHFGWKCAPLKKGAYGYDNLVYTVHTVFTRDEDITDLEKIAELIHDAWTTNYLFWRDNKPYEQNPGYRRPFNPIGDERRDKCASTKYTDLPEEEKNKDRVLAEIIVELTKNQ